MIPVASAFWVPDFPGLRLEGLGAWEQAEAAGNTILPRSFYLLFVCFLGFFCHIFLAVNSLIKKGELCSEIIIGRNLQA